MNKERLLALAELLRQVDRENPKAFNMGVWGSDLAMRSISQGGKALDIADCNTPGCIAGWCAALAYHDPTYTPFTNDSATVGMDYLDLPAGEIVHELFTPDLVRYSEVTAAMAADVVEQLAETGQVAWFWRIIKEEDEL